MQIMQLTAICKAAHCVPLKQILSNSLTLKVMGLTAFFVFVLCLHVSAGGLTQQVNVTVTNAPAKQVFKIIQKQTGLTFFVDSELMDQAKAVTLNVKNASLPSVI